MFISFLYMFLATMCPSSGVITVNILKKIVHQVDFICKIIQGCTVNKI